MNEEKLHWSCSACVFINIMAKEKFLTWITEDVNTLSPFTMLRLVALIIKYNRELNKYCVIIKKNQIKIGNSHFHRFHFISRQDQRYQAGQLN